jgi:hypothetical protein
LDDSLARAAAEWAGDNPGKIVWYRHPALGERLAKYAPKGVKYYPAGSANGKKLVSGTGAAIASWRSHGTGLNLQRFWEALVLESPVAADKLNQLIGRLRRSGQTQHVVFRFPLHTPEILKAWEKTIAGAEKLCLMSQSQAILEADWDI